MLQRGIAYSICKCDAALIPIHENHVEMIAGPFWILGGYLMIRRAVIAYGPIIVKRGVDCFLGQHSRTFSVRITKVLRSGFVNQRWR